MDEKTAKNILDCIARSCGYSYSMLDYVDHICFVNSIFDNDYTYIFSEGKEMLCGYCGSYKDALHKLLKHLNTDNTVEYSEPDKHTYSSQKRHKRHKILSKAVLSKADLYGIIKFEVALEGIDLDEVMSKHG